MNPSRERKIFRKKRKTQIPFYFIFALQPDLADDSSARSGRLKVDKKLFSFCSKLSAGLSKDVTSQPNLPQLLVGDQTSLGILFEEDGMDYYSESEQDVRAGKKNLD